MKSYKSDQPCSPTHQSDTPLSPQQIRLQLAKICAGEEFRRSKRSLRFLSYIVEETLAGRAGRIKAYSVAISVLDRDETFDPQTDPMVRIEASQLRRRLERYYLTQGINDPVVIDLPKGGYVPVFRMARVTVPPGPRSVAPARSDKWRKPAAIMGTALLTVSIAAFAWSRQYAHPSYQTGAGLKTGSRIHIIPFSATTADDRSGMIANGLAEEVTQVLIRNGTVDVLAHSTKDGTAPQIQADMFLTGSVRSNAGVIRLTASLVDARMGTYVWTEAYDMPADAPVLTLQTALAASLGARLPIPTVGTTRVPTSSRMEAQAEEGNLQ